jgi:hypothetical protein
MPRQYTMSEKALAARRKQAPLIASKGGKARTSLSHYVDQVVSHAPELTPEELEKLRRLLAPVSGGAAE